MSASRDPRVAFFPDSFHEVNGVAHTSRQFEAWAARTGKPMLCVRAGGRKTQSLQRGSVEVLELPRGFASFPIEKDLRYDPLFARHGPAILSALRRFRPDVVHITGPSELGMLGAFFAHRLGIPLAASWHTNVHEYAARRAHRLLRLLPAWARPRVARFIQEISLSGAALFYKSARLLFAPNPELCSLLAQRTGRPCLLMTRGIDAGLFSPRHRTRPTPQSAGEWRLGYVGRLSVEKNVFLLPVVADELTAMGVDGCRFVIVGHGKEDAALRAALPSAIFTGVLQGETLAESYSDMDLFLFPSHTDTFGNVVLEAMASGVAAVVTPSGGPAYIVRSSSGGGCVARDEDFAETVAALVRSPERLAAMGRQARAYAETASWDAVFAGVYRSYEQILH